MYDKVIYQELSAFYLQLWRHLDAFDEDRWLRTESVPPVDKRLETLKSTYEDMGRLLRDTTLAGQIRKDFKDVKRLTEDYCREKPKPDSDWFQHARKMSSYCQELGLRYSEMAIPERIPRAASA